MDTLTLVTTLPSLVAIGLSSYMFWQLFPYRRYGTTKARYIYWAFVAVYGWGRVFTTFDIGGEFLRYHFNDLGFVAAYTLVLSHADLLRTNPRDRIRPSSGSAWALRINLTLMLIVGIIFELVTGVYIPTHRPGLTHYSRFDYVDTAMYVICWAILWVVAGKMWVVQKPVRLLPMDQRPNYRETATTLPGPRPKPEAQPRVTPGGRTVAPTSRTNGGPSAKKRPRR